MWPSEPQMWPSQGCCQGCCDWEQECRPRWGWGVGAGWEEETVHNSEHSKFQEGCGSEEESGLASDFVKRLSLILGKLDSYK